MIVALLIVICWISICEKQWWQWWWWDTNEYRWCESVNFLAEHDPFNKHTQLRLIVRCISSESFESKDRANTLNSNGFFMLHWIYKLVFASCPTPFLFQSTQFMFLIFGCYYFILRHLVNKLLLSFHFILFQKLYPKHSWTNQIIERTKTIIFQFSSKKYD